ncbi:phenol hydroxylase subunit [Thauera linaloolentis]|uniref:Phenol hydroxylase subunit n=1 Tax=Thauera linaloolentis (strain DSM 12138 / JCM 21573 / CCUG 41526 / CIP 105981 / IAM 15112 / NBRC 102519 / 47Lol) TaxID=1123367 RepID=N6YVS2_THAL4|nr:phenol hydroxylase subunit [Thauera linaloolentis]ENO86238.1 phenol hydroxylase subunit [Thauera linaloolentis 47Lol = DSM 12138]MCM8566956.1 phenol hydroxylase subunit [Thauera linaloolentis]
MKRAEPAIDINRKFVRLIELRTDGFVEFEFAIGDPGLYAEMLLPAEAYASFCRANGVTVLAPREGEEAEEDEDWNWNLHRATHQRFR